MIKILFETPNGKPLCFNCAVRLAPSHDHPIDVFVEEDAGSEYDLRSWECAKCARPL